MRTGPNPAAPSCRPAAGQGHAQLYSSRLLAQLSVELLAAGAAPGLCAARIPQPGPRRSWAFAASGPRLALWQHPDPFGLSTLSTDTVELSKLPQCLPQSSDDEVGDSLAR